MPARVTHFDIGTDDPERAIRFYQDVFGWRIEKFAGEAPMDYWLVTTGPGDEPGINGGLSKRREPLGLGAPAAWSCTVGVDDIDTYVQKITRAGGRIIMAKMPIRGVGWFVHAQDTEGNFFGLMQPDEAAR